jgi:hypothetical protein
VVVSVDYNGVGGVGIKITEEMIAILIDRKLFTSEEWEGDKHSCLETLGIIYEEAGSGAYGGDQSFYLFVAGETLDSVIVNAPLFIEKLAGVGIAITKEEIVVISDLCMW